MTMSGRKPSSQGGAMMADKLAGIERGPLIGAKLMNPEVADAIRIANKHLANGTIDQRKALAKEIASAICRHAELIAVAAIKRVALSSEQS